MIDFYTIGNLARAVWISLCYATREIYTKTAKKLSILKNKIIQSAIASGEARAALFIEKDPFITELVKNKLEK